MSAESHAALAAALRGDVPALRRVGVTLTVGEARRVRRWLWLARWLRVRSGTLRAQRIVLAACRPALGDFDRRRV